MRRRISLKPPNGPVETSAPRLSRDFSIAFSPPHTVYGCTRVLRITYRAYMYNLYIPGISYTYTRRNIGLCVSYSPRSPVRSRFPCQIRYDRLNFVPPTTDKSTQNYDIFSPLTAPLQTHFKVIYLKIMIAGINTVQKTVQKREKRDAIFV